MANWVKLVEIIKIIGIMRNIVIYLKNIYLSN